MTFGLFFATLAAAMIYVLTPGPAFLAIFALAAREGRMSGTWFVTGHLVGDLLWGTLALAAIVGVNQMGPLLFEILGLACGAYLIVLGIRALMAREAAGTAVVGGRHPLLAGLVFGVTNPKAYPVSVAMFTVLVGHYSGLLTWDLAPQVMLVAFLGFILADVILIAVAGLPAVRRFFMTHGLIVTRFVGVTFVLFGAKSVADAVQSYRQRA
ncbi:LysE family translocator [Phreatobacter sp.]|uniref:LysE family translocator n=1 Tax=Phreatobacter sp. TaxID=1966341 RepID=UPI0025E24260|nr:LysE family translocator [Phreatobacter sp.]